MQGQQPCDPSPDRQRTCASCWWPLLSAVKVIVAWSCSVGVHSHKKCPLDTKGVARPIESFLGLHEERQDTTPDGDVAPTQRACASLYLFAFHLHRQPQPRVTVANESGLTEPRSTQGPPGLVRSPYVPLATLAATKDQVKSIQ